jgi:hypothetical protein
MEITDHIGLVKKLNVKNNRLYFIWDLLSIVLVDSGSSLAGFFGWQNRKDYSNPDHCGGNNILSEFIYPWEKLLC